MMLEAVGGGATVAVVLAAHPGMEAALMTHHGEAVTGEVIAADPADQPQQEPHQEAGLMATLAVTVGTVTALATMMTSRNQIQVSCTVCRFNSFAFITFVLCSLFSIHESD